MNAVTLLCDPRHKGTQRGEVGNANSMKNENENKEKLLVGAPTFQAKKLDLTAGLKGEGFPVDGWSWP